MTTLPNTNGTDSAEQRYDRCVRWYNIAVGRYNSGRPIRSTRQSANTGTR